MKTCGIYKIENSLSGKVSVVGEHERDGDARF